VSNPPRLHESPLDVAVALIEAVADRSPGLVLHHPAEGLPRLVFVPVRWIALTVVFQVLDGWRIQAAYEVQALFTRRRFTFHLAVGDLSRLAILNLFLMNKSWDLTRDAQITSNIADTIRKERPRVLGWFGTLKSYADEIDPHRAEADEFPEFVDAAAAARQLLANSAGSQARRREARLARAVWLRELGIGDHAAPRPRFR
jgi:hypothetical protein